MSDIGDMINDMTVRAQSPDKRIRAMLRGRGLPTVSFASPDGYAQYRDVESLASQVSTAIERVMAGVDQGRRALIREKTHLSTAEGPHWDASRRRMHEELRDLKSWGESVKGVVRVETVGLRAWRVRIRPGSLERLKAGEFLREVNSAIAVAEHAHRVNEHEVKAKYLGSFGAPPLKHEVRR
ncbi:MAG TPA: hypothetical protein VE172_23950 [Stackebrandtia sp.]|jgi:hypothetical protein|uniref:hypothetical protein n=1 Tax=Stackebrandtia sp. TaxID=2023065 RepID=UPI002D51349B|nr:hypothetical protein [Stackebrandtia sp.]HZE41864.1 hypothetical protein [Stackebrandtia sp.]